MSTEYKFQGWLGHDQEAAKGNLVWGEYNPKPFEDTDVDFQITHCGICATDLHILRGSFGPPLYPLCVGHETVGKVVRVGSKAEGGLKIGDRVGVGAQVSSCLKPDCYECTHDDENYCQHQMTIQYNGVFPDGSRSYGGFADYGRAPSHFVFKIPDGLPSDAAAPMLCGGITAFSPMLRHGAGPGKAVGVVGIGGLGHYGLLSAKVLGVEKLVAISRNSAKKQDCFQMGATDFVATDEDEDWAGKHTNSLDLIISTVASPKMPLRQYLQMLKVGGIFCVIGAEDNLPTVNAFDLLPKRLSIVGSGIGSPKEIREMLDLFAKKGVRSWTNNVPLKEANQALLDMDAGKARYRFVLVNDKHTKDG